MAIAHENTWGDSNNSSVETFAVVIGTAAGTAAAASSGNLLVAVLNLRYAMPLDATPTGWTEAFVGSTSGSVPGSSAWYRIASGTSADDFSVDWTGSSRPAVQIREYSGCDATIGTVLNGQATNITQETGSVITIGTAKTPTSQPGVAVGVCCPRESIDWDTSATTVASPFGNLSVEGINGSNRPVVYLADYLYSSTGEITATFDTTDSGGEVSAAILLFNAAGGGPTPHPAGPFGHPLSGALGGPI
jgi:hypothetical protein